MNFSKYRCFFQININDIRSDFFLLILNDIIDRNNAINLVNFNNSIFIQNIKDNNEYNCYLLDLSATDCIIDFTNIDITTLPPNYITIIQTFFTVEENRIDITNNITKWKNATKIIRKKDKIIKVTNIIASYSYIPSKLTTFTFNIDIINNILSSMINNIPNMKQLDYIFDEVVYKCIKVNKEKNYASHLEQCILGKDIKECLNFMKMDKFEDNIINEVKMMAICDAVDMLIKFGFLYTTSNNKVIFETILSWEKRIKNKLHINEINKNLIKYLQLLHNRINPVSELRNVIAKTGYSVSSMLLKYFSKNPQYNKLIYEYTVLEKEYNTSRYICNMYSNLMSIFNSKYYKKIFNHNNMYIYNCYRDKIHSKYLIHQTDVLDLIEHKYHSIKI